MEWEFSYPQGDSSCSLNIAPLGAIIMERNRNGSLQVRLKGHEYCCLVSPQDGWNSNWTLFNQEGKRIGESLPATLIGSRKPFSLLGGGYLLDWSNEPLAALRITELKSDRHILQMGLHMNSNGNVSVLLQLAENLDPESLVPICGLAWFYFEPVARENTSRKTG